MGAGQNVPATKRDLASVESSLTRDIANLRNELWRHTAELQAQAIRLEIRNQFESIGRGMREIIGEMRELRREFRTIKWMAAALLAVMALADAALIVLALS